MRKLLALLLLVAAPAFGQAPSKPQGFIWVEDTQGHIVSTLSAYSGSSAATRGSTLISKAASGSVAATQVFHLAGTTYTCGSIPSTTPSYKGQGATTVITISGSTLSQLATFMGKCTNLTVVGSDGTRYIDSTGTAFSTVGNTNGITMPHPSTTISGTATTPGFFVGPNSSTNNPAFNVTRTIGGDIATHAYDDFTTYTLTKSTTGAASFAGEATVNLAGFTLGHYNWGEPFTAFTVNGSGELTSVVGVGITTPGGTGVIKTLRGINCEDFGGRATGTLFEGGNVFLHQDHPSNYQYRSQASFLGKLILGSWTNEAFEASTSKFVVYEPWTLDGSARGSTWPGILGVGAGAVTNTSGGTQFGSYGADKGFYYGGASYYIDADFVSTAKLGQIGFLKTNGTSANSAGYISLETNDNGGATTNVQHARIDSSGVKLPDLTASTVVFTDSNKYLTSTGTVAVSKIADSVTRMVASKGSQAQSTTTTETTLWDTAAFAKSLSSAGDTYHYKISGRIAQHASRTREIKVYMRYNTSQYFAIGDTGAIVVDTANPIFIIEGTITHRGAGNDEVFTRITINGATGAPIADSMGFNDFGAAVEGIKITGQCGAGSSNGDITLESGQVWYTGKEP